MAVPSSSPNQPRSPEDKRNGFLLGIAGAGLDIGELLLIAVPYDYVLGETIVGGVDLLVTGQSCQLTGECEFTKPVQPHPDLPPMFIGGQDVFVTGFDAFFPAGIGVMVKNFEAMMVVDIMTSSFSLVYDIQRLSGTWQNRVSVGVDHDNTGYILIYPGPSGD